MGIKVGVIGPKEAVMLFKMVGFDVAYTDDVQSAVLQLEQWAMDHGIIYVTESLAQQMESAITNYTDQITPAIIVIPNHQGSNGYGQAQLANHVTRAIGQNILTNENNDSQKER